MAYDLIPTTLILLWKIVKWQVKPPPFEQCCISESYLIANSVSQNVSYAVFSLALKPVSNQFQISLRLNWFQFTFGCL